MSYREIRQKEPPRPDMAASAGADDRVNRLVLVAILCALIGAAALFVPLLEAVALTFGVFAVVFGAVAALRLAREPAGRGRWLAIVGVVFGMIVTGIAVSRADQTIFEFDGGNSSVHDETRSARCGALG